MKTINSQLPEPIFTYFTRYRELYSKLFDKDATAAKTEELLRQPSCKAELNNLFMAGLGLGTLLNRICSVISLAKKLNDPNKKPDNSFQKKILSNLREVLPSDTNWKNIWETFSEKGDWFNEPVIKDKNGNTLVQQFVKLRNDYAHDNIKLQADYATQITKAIQLLDRMAEIALLYEGTQVIEENQQIYFIKDNEKILLHPFVVTGPSHEGDAVIPYIFQGLFDNKVKAHFIGTYFGDEHKTEAAEQIEPQFRQMIDTLMGLDKVFDHSNRIDYYMECFVGRDKELEALYKWTQQDDGNNIFPVFSSAGMGKGALLAGLIKKLESEKQPELYHFCGSGNANNLHTVLYHFILQGKSYWQNQGNEINNRVTRLPSKYQDLIAFFQLLLDNYKPGKNAANNNLIIIIDGLDEAAVAHKELGIGDWFQKYNEKGEAEENWECPKNIKWILTYREGFYTLPGYFAIEKENILQPLKGLAEEAVLEALKGFNPSKELIENIIVKATIQ